jgi:hypothetical protein
MARMLCWAAWHVERVLAVLCKGSLASARNPIASQGLSCGMLVRYATIHVLTHGATCTCRLHHNVSREILRLSGC